MIAIKHNQSYSQTVNWLRCRLRFSLLSSLIMCIRGSRSSVNQPAKPQLPEAAIDCAICDSRVAPNWTATFCFLYHLPIYYYNFFLFFYTQAYILDHLVHCSFLLRSLHQKKKKMWRPLPDMLILYIRVLGAHCACCGVSFFCFSVWLLAWKEKLTWLSFESFGTAHRLHEQRHLVSHAAHGNHTHRPCPLHCIFQRTHTQLNCHRWAQGMCVCSLHIFEITVGGAIK